VIGFIGIRSVDTTWNLAVLEHFITGEQRTTSAKT
jgi:hypothetical protein